MTSLDDRVSFLSAVADPPRPLALAEVLDALHRDQNALIGLAVTLLRDRAAAQDAVQDTFEAIVRLRPTFPNESAALAYARTAVVNRCRSALRRQRTAWRYLARQGPPPDAPPADERLLLAEEHQVVLAHFYRLPQRQREVLTLRHFTQLRDAEIADALSISVSTVRSNASRGIAALARLLEGDPS